MFKLHDHWSDASAWDAFVSRHAQARFCHLFGYGQVLNCYGYRARAVCFTFAGSARHGEIAALIPVTEIRSPWQGGRLISQPFCEYGGPLFDAALSIEQVSELIEALRSHLSGAVPDAVLEIHGNLGVPSPLRESLFVQRNPHGLASLPLGKGSAALWDEAIKYEVRKSIKKARRSEVEVLDECTPEAIRRDFFPMYAASMKRLGVPPHKIDFFLECQRVLGERMRILWAIKDSKRVAALLGFNSGRRIAITNTVSDPAYWQYCPNDLVHWEYICSAIDQGCEYFDFGSVRYDGQRLFKSKWGCELSEQAYCFLAGSSQRVRTFDSSSSVMQQLSGVWSRYVPPRLAQRVGPMIRRVLAR